MHANCILRPLLFGFLTLVIALLSGFASAADKGDFRPKPDTYLCPNASGDAVDCFLDAVDHLYTMCRQVKSIELIEFGYENAEQGVNGAKTLFCLDKHKLSITRPYRAALREARGSRTALAALEAMHARWLRSLGELQWQPPETDAEYKARVARPYEVFRAQASFVRAVLLTARARKADTHVPARATTLRTTTLSQRGTN